MRPDLDELRRLLADATPGPWHDTYEHYVSDELAGPDGKSLLHARSNSDDPEPCFRHTPDAQLVIAMRNAMPALLAEAEAGRKLREATRGLVIHGHYRHGSNCAECRAVESVVRGNEEYDAAVGVE